MSHELFEAIDKHDSDKVDFLLKNGVSPNESISEAPYWRPLEAAIEEIENGGNIEIVKSLIDYGADINACSNQPEKISHLYPIHCAVFNDNYEVLKLLLIRGADPNVKTDDGEMPLNWAVENQKYDMAELLLKYGADKQINFFGGHGGMSALDHAVQNLDIPMITLLLDAGADPKAKDADNQLAQAYLPERDISNIQKWEEAAALLNRHKKQV